MESSSEKAKRVLTEAIDAIERIFNLSDMPNLSDEYKYDQIFRIYGQELTPCLKELCIRFEYYDPDASYQDDIRALVNALKPLDLELRSTRDVYLVRCQ